MHLIISNSKQAVRRDRKAVRRGRKAVQQEREYGGLGTRGRSAGYKRPFRWGREAVS